MTSNKQITATTRSVSWWLAGAVFAVFVAGKALVGAVEGEEDLRGEAVSAAGLGALLWVFTWVMAKLIPGKYFQWTEGSKAPKSMAVGLVSAVAAFTLIWFLMGYAGVGEDRLESGVRSAGRGALGCLIGVVPGLILMARYHDRAHPMLVGAVCLGWMFVGLAFGGAGADLASLAWWQTHAAGVFGEAIYGATFGAFLAWQHLREDASAIAEPT